MSIHSVTEAEAIDAAVVDYAIAGPAFETASKPGYGPEIGRKGLAEIAAAARVPILAIGGINVTRAAEVLAAGPAGIAVMGGRDAREKCTFNVEIIGVVCGNSKQSSQPIWIRMRSPILNKRRFVATRDVFN